MRVLTRDMKKGYVNFGSNMLLIEALVFYDIFFPHTSLVSLSCGQRVLNSGSVKTRSC